MSPPMLYIEFVRILTEEGLTPRQAQALWDTRPTDDLDEGELKETARAMKVQGF